MMPTHSPRHSHSIAYESCCMGSKSSSRDYREWDVFLQQSFTVSECLKRSGSGIICDGSTYFCLQLDLRWAEIVALVELVTPRREQFEVFALPTESSSCHESRFRRVYSTPRYSVRGYTHPGSSKEPRNASVGFEDHFSI